MIIVLEGPDRGGKSTLAHYLLDKYNFGCYLHATYRPGMDVAQHHHDITIAAKCSNMNTVVDRFWISEMVYGSIFRSQWYGYDIAEFLETLLCPKYTVFCLPSYDKWIETFKRDIETEMFKDIEKMEMIYKQYEKNYNELKKRCDIMLFDWTEETLDNVANRIIF
jgi:thymidylate kinase